MKWGVRVFLMLNSTMMLAGIQQLTSYSVDTAQQMSLSFSTVYPQSSLKNLVSMVMRLWATVNELQHGQSAPMILTTADTFAQQALLLNTALDTTLIDAARIMHDCPECVQAILNDMQHLLSVVHEIITNYAQISNALPQKHIACAASLFILEQIIKKMEKVIAHGTIPANVYTLSKVHQFNGNAPFFMA